MNRGNTPMRYKDEQCHYLIQPDGEILLLHPIDKWIVASSMFNDAGIAIEIVGNFPDDKGNYWNGHVYGQDTLTEAQIRNARYLLEYLRRDYGIWCVFAHRQGERADLRGNCPGPDIWYHIGQWAVNNLDMFDGGPGYTEGPGSPIPDSWRKPRKVKGAAAGGGSRD
jgi:hypothetical protein